jgi:endonuclease-3
MTYIPRSRVAKACTILENAFGVPSRRGHDDLVSMLIRTILSQNTNDTNRDRAFDSLRKEFPKWETLADAPLKKIARAIRVGGLANQKSATIKNIIRFLRDTRGKVELDFIRGMSNEEAYKYLCAHKGIGVKTASIILCFGCGHDVFPVDTHVNRICARLGFVPEGSTPDKTHELMSPLVPKGKAYSFHLNLIRLGKTICTARNPRHEICPLRRMCSACHPAKVRRERLLSRSGTD